MQKKSKPRAQSQNRRIPLSRAERYAQFENRHREKIHLPQSSRPTHEPKNTLPRAPPAASSAYQLSLFANSSRGQSVDSLRQGRDQPADPRIAFPPSNSTWNSKRVPLIRTPEDSLSDENSEGDMNSDIVMTFIPNYSVSTPAKFKFQQFQK